MFASSQAHADTSRVGELSPGIESGKLKLDTFVSNYIIRFSRLRVRTNRRPKE
jgi:hypothetical protein